MQAEKTFIPSKKTMEEAADLEGVKYNSVRVKIAETNASFDAALGRVQGVVDALNAKVADLKVDVARGVAAPEDLAALDALRDRIDALDPTKPAVLPGVPAQVSSPTPDV